MSKIKAIVLDLDGTLLDDNKKIGDLTKNVLKEAKEKIRIILASARGFWRIKPYLEELDLLDDNNYTICFNGSVVVNNNEKIVLEEYINSDDIKLCYDIFNNENIDWSFYLYDNRVKLNEIDDLDTFLQNNKIYKIVGVSTNEIISDLRDNISSEIKDKFQITSSELNRIEFVAKGMTKIKSIEMLLNKLNIDKENIIAFGDGDNDIEMIKYAGIGIAMKNAPSNVKECADIVTDFTNNEDGVGIVLKNIINEEIEE